MKRLMISVVLIVAIFALVMIAAKRVTTQSRIYSVLVSKSLNK